MLQEESGGQLILLTGSSIENNPILSQSDQVTVHTIAFPSRTAFINLTNNGLQLAVDDSNETTGATSQSRLTAAFLHILGYHSQVSMRALYLFFTCFLCWLKNKNKTAIFSCR